MHAFVHRIKADFLGAEDFAEEDPAPYASCSTSLVVHPAREEGNNRIAQGRVLPESPSVKPVLCSTNEPWIRVVPSAR